MKLSLTTFALLASSAAAFTTSSHNIATISTATTSTALEAGGLNGWVPDESKFAWGLPGALPPFADGFDPLGLGDSSLKDMMYFREAETQHGRVAMLAVVGFLVQEPPINFHPFFETNAKTLGPAIYHLDEVRAVAPQFFTILTLFIAFAELNRALTGWEAPQDEKWTLRSDYYPGDIGFDPLGLKPDNTEEFFDLSTKELQNGRLAMLGAMGFIAQELTNGVPVFGFLDPEGIKTYSDQL